MLMTQAILKSFLLFIEFVRRSYKSYVNNKIIIEFGFRMISRIIKVLVGVIMPTSALIILNITLNLIQ